MARYLILAVSFSLFMAVAPESKSQCKINVSHEVKAVMTTSASGSILLKFEVGESKSFEIVLYKITGEPKKVESRFEASPTTVLFKNLESGDYVISIDQQDGCRIMIGGLEGIRIKDERK